MTYPVCSLILALADQETGRAACLSAYRVLMSPFQRVTNMLKLNWLKSKADTWLKLRTMNLASISVTSGVYIIWHTGNPGRVVRVGQGDIAERMTCHRTDADVLHYEQYGELRATWASVPAHQLDGVERYLADHWKPPVGDRFPNVAPIAVNSPFAA